MSFMTFVLENGSEVKTDNVAGGLAVLARGNDDDPPVKLLVYRLQESLPRELAVALGENKTVTSLVVDGNHVGEEGGAWVAEVLERSTTIASLDLSHNLVGDNGVRLIGQSLARNASLISLNLSGAGVGPVGASAIAAALATNSTLQSLNLSDNNLGLEGGDDLAAALATNTTLTSLYHTAGCTPAASERINEVLARNHALANLARRRTP